MKKFDLSKFAKGSSPQKALLDKSRELVQKWSPTGLLEGLDKEQDVHGVAILLENQYRQLIHEANRTGTSEGAEEWSGVALPLVRRVFGEIVAKEFVSVQPMNLPSGLIFYLDFKYGSSQPGFNVGDSIFGETDVDGPATGGLYGSARFGYSINDVRVTDVPVKDAGTVGGARVSFHSALVDDLDGLSRVTVSLPERIDTLGVRAFTIEAPDIAEYYPAYTRYVGPNDDGTHDVEFVVRAADGAGDYGTASGQNAEAVSVEYHVQPTAYDRGDFEDRSPNPNVATSGYEVLDIPEIDFDLQSEPIAAKTRKLKAVWTPELAQDLNAYHSIDAEAELTSMLSEYISMEIDLEILDMLIQSALTKEYWSARPNTTYNPSTGQFEERAGTHTGTLGQWYQTLGNKVQKVSNRIHQKTMRGGANFIVCSPDVATILESAEGFRTDTVGDQAQFAMGVQRAGQLQNRFTVYKNPYMIDNVILVGFRGNNFLEAGAIYAPYVPLIMTPIVYDPNNFTPRRGVMTRYAKRVVRPEFYGLVVIGDMGAI